MSFYVVIVGAIFIMHREEQATSIEKERLLIWPRNGCNMWGTTKKESNKKCHYMHMKLYKCG